MKARIWFVRFHTTAITESKKKIGPGAEFYVFDAGM